MKHFVIALFKKMGTDDCLGLASEMAYSLILSLIPLFIFLVSLLGIIGGQKTLYPLLEDFIIRMTPIHTSSMVLVALDAIIQGSSKGLTMVGFGGSLLSASNTGFVIIKGLQRIYQMSDVKFPVWYIPLLSIGIVLSLGVSMLVAVQFILFGTYLIDWLYQYSRLYENAVVILHLLRWLIIILYIWMITAYTYALILRPKLHHLAWKKSLFGAFVFVGTWIAGSFLFSLYVERMHQFNPIYGTLGALIILITWLYFSSLVFLLGAEITALHIPREKL